jgi:hypothetical protein
VNEVEMTMTVQVSAGGGVVQTNQQIGLPGLFGLVGVCRLMMTL